MYTITDIMECLRMNERAVRKLFVDAGVKLDENKSDMNEFVSREDVVLLLVDRAEQREGMLLADLLKGKKR